MAKIYHVMKMLHLPSLLQYQTVIMEGMFININPWSGHKNIGEYATFLHIVTHFTNRTTNLTYSLMTQCHIQRPNPTSADHPHNEFTADTPKMEMSSCNCRKCKRHLFTADTPKMEMSSCNCRKCKRHLVNFLSRFLEQIKRLQKFVTAGGFEEQSYVCSF